MHIIIVNDFAYVDGGASQIALASARGLAERGHRITFFSAVGPVDNALLGHGNIQVHCLGQLDVLRDPNRLRAILRGVWNTKAANYFDQLLGQADPRDTVVHFHLWIKALTASIFAKPKRRGIASVATLHDYFSACPTGSFYDFPAKQICHRAPLGMACTFRQCDRRNYGHKLWRVLRQHAQRRLGQFPSSMRHFIIYSNLGETILRPFLPADARVHRVGNPIDFPKQPAANVALNRHFTFVGRLASEKAPQHFATAAARLGVDARFVGEGVLRGEIASIYPTAQITGWQNPKQVQAHLLSARALVFPSVWYETQGLVVAEAAAFGVPAIVSNTSAATEFVIDGETGLTFKTGDLDDLQEKLKQMTNDAFVARLGLAAYERHWADPPTIARHAEKLEAVYSECLKK
ncbi:MAG TPA: glycosyltransferase family 4 protein [Verrucomicrobiae bacterium]|jgi:glycosyltransferase involved in cell wall biosynthesis